MKTRIVWTFAQLPGFAAVESPDASASASPQIAAKVDGLVDRGRLRIAASVETFLREVEEHPSTRVLPITSRIAAESTRLGPTFPRDPADRLIAAAARCHGLALMTVDRGIRDSGTVAIA